jgi:hypothetical protein
MRASPPRMNHTEYSESTVRRFLTVLFTLRARRHLRTLAELYGWSPEQLADAEVRFIRPIVPRFVAAAPS